MKLKTLGGLSLEGSTFKRETPLLMLAYLALEGEQTRDFLAELIWQRQDKVIAKKQRRNNLSRVLSDLRKFAPGTFDASSTSLWTNVSTDAQDLQLAFETKDYERVLTLYGGSFLEGHESHWGLELEEWLYEKRAQFAALAQRAQLALAEEKAATGQFVEAATRAQLAYELKGTEPPEPEALGRYYLLLVAGGHPLAAGLKREAKDYDIDLEQTQEEARARLQPSFIGRERTLKRLSSLPAGSWTWLKGAKGMGKSALLKSLPGTFLPARSGLPYATLEPLIGTSVSEGEEMMVQTLRQQTGVWLIDDWEQVDPESQSLLLNLRKLKPKVAMIIASKESAPFEADVSLELGSLSQEALTSYPHLYEKTGGLPELVGAYLRGEPLEAALETRLAALNAETRNVYLSLALLEQPDLALVRRALGLSAAQTSQALDSLLQAGLVELSGEVRALSTTREFLETQPSTLGALALPLARLLPPLQAFPLYQKTRALWTLEDGAQVEAAYLAWAQELLRRGAPKTAEAVLKNAPAGDEVTLLRARALERAGQFRDALSLLVNLEETPSCLALKGFLHMRLGQPDKAKQAADEALKGDMEDRADASNTLGHLAMSKGNYQEAEGLFQRSATLWLALGRRSRWVDAQNNLAVARSLQEEAPETAFAEALEAAGENPLLRARVLLNLGVMYERKTDFAEAEASYQAGAKLAAEAGSTATAARLQNNLGVLFHRQDRTEDAKRAYEQALRLAQQAGDQRILGMAMANLAELTFVFETWQEALLILESSGHAHAAAVCRKNLAADHPFHRAARQEALTDT